jgi:RNA polymerase sigma factor (sigma-70 family)
MGWESQMIDVDTALRKLAVLDPRQARVIESRFFAGMTEAEIAVQVGVSERTIKRDCKAGIAWLHAELNGTPKSTAATKS